MNFNLFNLCICGDCVGKKIEKIIFMIGIRKSGEKGSRLSILAEFNNQLLTNSGSKDLIDSVYATVYLEGGARKYFSCEKVCG